QPWEMDDFRSSLMQSHEWDSTMFGMKQVLRNGLTAPSPESISITQPYAQRIMNDLAIAAGHRKHISRPIHDETLTFDLDEDI
ncbi:hypothetical protein KDA11_00760, partial [Candidatus Saccharibacteria bacterium]|nr:hypothetical protein [Candidatus Saccharibacteria bacterium]